MNLAPYFPMEIEARKREESAAMSGSTAVDTSALRAIVEEMRSQYAIALDHAYCPSSTPYNSAMAAVADLNAAFISIMESVERRQGNSELNGGAQPSVPT
jgi:GTP cyclohydrolase III